MFFPAVSAIEAKVIIKDVNNTIGIGYSITIIQESTIRESTTNTMEATTFREIKDLTLFLVFFILFQFF